MQPQMPTTVNIQQPRGPDLLLRALYFVFIGWWLGFLWLQVGFVLCILIVVLPIGLVMLNRVPQVLTLCPANNSPTVHVTSAMGSGSFVQTVNVAPPRQASFLIRAIYFVFIGSWVGWLWANVGYFLCVLVVTMSVGLLMLNRLPAVSTRRKN